MPYQSIDRAQFRPGNQTLSIEDPGTRDAISKVIQDYNKLAQEVVSCHNLIQNFAVTIANGLTTLAITLAIPMPDTGYAVGANFNFNNGGYWVTGKTKTGFTLNWATATVGAQAVRFLVVG
jgi:hypothetical protein